MAPLWASASDDFDEQNMRDFERDLFFDFGGHDYFSANGCFDSSTSFSKR